MAAALAAMALILSACDRPETEPQTSSTTQDMQMAKPERDLAPPTDKSATLAAPARDDAAILANVKEALNADPLLKQADITVEANGGAVTLSGSVDTISMRTHAYRVAATAPGVTNVIDNISVKSTG
jgi:osmotically-inducible protein OsmY